MKCTVTFDIICNAQVSAAFYQPSLRLKTWERVFIISTMANSSIWPLIFNAPFSEVRVLEYIYDFRSYTVRLYRLFSALTKLPSCSRLFVVQPRTTCHGFSLPQETTQGSSYRRHSGPCASLLKARREAKLRRSRSAENLILFYFLVVTPLTDLKSKRHVLDVVSHSFSLLESRDNLHTLKRNS